MLNKFLDLILFLTGRTRKPDPLGRYQQPESQRGPPGSLFPLSTEPTGQGTSFMDGNFTREYGYPWVPDPMGTGMGTKFYL
jgi:hypothetical protein